ncbi:hypothetical protein BH20ACI1_BH20ACI1_32670 [soil metagenome]
MVDKKSFLKFLLILPICILFFCQTTIAQKTDNQPKAILVESGQYKTSEMASLDIDMWRIEIGKNPNSKGLIIVYCGKKCQYGEVEAHLRGIYLSLRGKGVKKQDYIIFQGGFREEFTIEYWVVPENACLPTPNSTVEIKDVKFKGTYKSTLVPYDCC